MNSPSSYPPSRAGSLSPARTFTQQFSATRRGARLARLLAVNQFEAWGWPHGTETSGTAALLVAELASNAVLHGRVEGRDFRLRLTVDDTPARQQDEPGPVLRIEVTDARGECLPRPAEGPRSGTDPRPGSAAAYPESGHGLLLVRSLATRWGVEPYPPSGKTVWCEMGVGNGTPRPLH
ncbi:ATP-binding protein [Streptomyces sp. TS71-3]|uniref:ATP-binding protein n=1 Tax=Streptomyces sp. TS71-3 TaxID=2733862 RepID=UPI001B2E01FB|nr:ATP-binding protein [Streptomyces sp. TS71-3]GHJ38422.1 ATP-binding protein [Streptomyces sp. TS71-3]